ncbi:hypothetical protein L0F63_001660 [Massospora cicadina]|nr:hypothetical protein L0F63_001660 [Massospora cicadina]
MMILSEPLNKQALLWMRGGCGSRPFNVELWCGGEVVGVARLWLDYNRYRDMFYDVMSLAVKGQRCYVSFTGVDGAVA